MFFLTKEFKLKLPDTTIDAITFGKGPKPLVMIQGLNTRGIRGSGAGLAYMYRIFARDYTVYLFDRRPDICEKATVRDFASDVAKAMDALQITDACVFGVSQGGMIAEYLAIDRPDLVSKLVLAVTLSRNNDTVQTVVRHWMDLAQQNRMRELVEDMAVKMYSPAYLKRYRLFIPLLTVLQKPKDVKRFSILAASCLTCAAHDELEKIRCPVFVIGGRQDQVVGCGASEEIARKLGCKLFIYEHLGHAAYEEAKNFNRKVYDFLKE